MSALRTSLVVGALTLVLASCTSSRDVPQASPSPSSSSSTASPAVRTSHRPVVPPPPKPQGCYRLTVAELPRPTNDSTPVPCRSRHTAQTIYIGRLDTVVDGHAIAVDSPTVQRQIERTCPRKLAGYLGGTAADRNLTRFRVVWFSPTLEQSDQGANWFRCDVVAFARGDTLYPLPGPKRLHHALDGGKGLATYGLCGTAAPGAKGFTRVACGLRHSWKAFSTIPLAGAGAYPGQAAVRRGGEDTCKSQAQQRSGNSLKYSYGWEWPSRQQWAAGQHYGYCWAPD
jgi:hypothetical protein